MSNLKDNLNIKKNDYVLEVGPGGKPHPRANILLEKRFASEDIAKAQRGYANEPQTDKKIVYYNGDLFPFQDNEFDYVICSHVLEHIDACDIEKFVNELQRVAKGGYLEFPLIYYDYIFDFPEHVTALFYNKSSGIIYLAEKNSVLPTETFLVRKLYYEALKNNSASFDFIKELQYLIYQGFEWNGSLQVEKTDKIECLCHDVDFINSTLKPLPKKSKIQRICEKWAKFLKI
ncbi:MAG: class I SAM-dependent methyltransferase [Campylobacterales bacterium]